MGKNEGRETDEELHRIRLRKMREFMQRQSKPRLEAPITLTEAGFEEMTKKFPVLVVDCWAEWCTPCYMIAPIIEELALKYAGKVVFGKLNVDEAQATAMKYNVMSIPTLLFFKGGKLVDRVIGAVPKEHIEWMLKKIIG